MSPAQSPFEAVLGDHFGQLHPTLQEYFSAIPAGGAGIGEGVFDTVGTPRRWLHPILRLFVPKDVLFGVWERDDPFTVINTPVREGGRSAVAGERVFALTQGDRVMRDLMVATPEGIVDIMGKQRRFRALFAAHAIDGDRQHVSVSVRVPILGTVYEYAGSFRYDRKAVAPCGS